MLKLILAFIGFLLLAVVIAMEGRELFVSFYVLFPFLLFPFFYFVQCETRFFSGLAAVILAILFGAYLISHPTNEILIFGALCFGIAAVLFFYRRQWQRAFRAQKIQAQTIHDELEALKNKHILRLDSLHHLEKQVSSLMDLFEIARDFSDCLSFGSMADLLYKKVMPELPFRKMRLSLLKKDEIGMLVPERIFTISPEGVSSEEGDLTAEESETLSRRGSRYEMVKKNDAWIFPLPVEEEVSAICQVAGADSSDLAKFEVLVAHLILQVKKIRLYETVKELSIRDGLTGVFVRRHFLERLEDEIRRSSRHGLSLALLMLDIDHFKRYNDDFGHLVGDATLKEVASLLRTSLRNVDVVARYGGEEFVVIIPETKREAALEVAERIRSNVARNRFKLFDAQSQVTVSLGVVLFPEDVRDILETKSVSEIAFELINHADKALYRAKEEGRNRVVLFQNL